MCTHTSRRGAKTAVVSISIGISLSIKIISLIAVLIATTTIIVVFIIIIIIIISPLILPVSAVDGAQAEAVYCIVLR
jgi:hypothetical protein